LQWVMYERLKRVFRTEEKKGTIVKRGYKEKLGEALGAGFFAKLIATVVTYPHEVFFPKDFALESCGLVWLDCSVRDGSCLSEKVALHGT
jgi:hypothetical protein